MNMKKLAVVTTVASILFIGGISGTGLAFHKLPVNKENTQSAKTVAVDEEKKDKLFKFLSLANEGKVPNSGSFEIGSTEQSVFESWGEPDDRSNNVYGSKYTYNLQQVSFLIDTHGQFGMKDKVRGLTYFGDEIQGLTLEGVKKVFSIPDEFIEDDLIFLPTEKGLFAFKFDKQQNISQIIVTAPKKVDNE